MALNYNQIDFPPYPESDLPVCPKVVIDPTLSILGRAADAKVTGDALHRKLDGEDIIRSLSLTLKPDPITPGGIIPPYPSELPHVEIDGFMEASQYSIAEKIGGGLVWKTVADVAFTGDYLNLVNRPDEAIYAAIQEVRDDLSREADRSRTEDDLLKNRCTALETDVADLKPRMATAEEHIALLKVTVAQEIQDRKAADAELLTKLAQETSERTLVDGQLSDRIDTVDRKIDEHISESDSRLKDIEEALPIQDFKGQATVAQHLGQLYKNDQDLTAKITAEEERAIAAETKETQERSYIDGQLATRIDTEESRAKNMESSILEELRSEENRAMTKEGEIDTNLQAEITRAKAAESTLTTAIAEEEKRAKAKESSLDLDVSTLTGKINLLDNRVTTAESNVTKLDARVTTAETKLSTETDERKAEDINLKNLINTEVSRATAQESAILNELRVEETRATNQESAILNELRVEEQRAKNQELIIDQKVTNNTTAISEEASARVKGDSDLQVALSSTNASLTSEINRSTLADTNLETNLNAEINRATIAESNLDTKIELVKATLNSEITRATAAEEALNTLVDAKVTGSVGNNTIFNETAGAGIQWKDSTAQNSNAFIEVVSDNADKRISIYADDGSNEAGIYVNANGAYYTKGTQAIVAEEDEIVVKKDIKDLTSALKYIGMTTVASGESIEAAILRLYQYKGITTPVAGHIVILVQAEGPVEYIYDGSTWQEFGNEGLYATKAELSAEATVREAADTLLTTSINDLYTKKQDVLTAGTHITIENNTISTDATRTEVLETSTSTIAAHYLKIDDTEYRLGGQELVAGDGIHIESSLETATISLIPCTATISGQYVLSCTIDESGNKTYEYIKQPDTNEVKTMLQSLGFIVS